MGWSDVRELCESVLAEVDDLAQASTTDIRRELPVYESVDFQEHLAAVRRQQSRRLLALAERRELTESDLEESASLARRRARHGLPVDALIGAYHVGDRELWRRLIEQPGPAKESLPEVAALLISSLHQISVRSAAAHAETSLGLHGRRFALQRRLLDLLRESPESLELTELADSLELDLSSDHAVAVVRSRGGTIRAEQPPDGHVPPAMSIQVGGETVLFLPPGAVDRLLRRFHRPEAMIGLGSVGRGGRGLARSLQEASLAVAAATPDHSVVRFTRDWQLALAVRHWELIRPLLGAAPDVARGAPDLRTTVLEFAAQDMSIARTARACFVHANTVKYRLDRWSKLTKLDPRRLEDLQLSVIACRLFDSTTVAPGAPPPSLR